LPDDVVPKSQRSGAESRTREAIANLRSDLGYLRRQQHELRCRFHGELAVLALRIEDNERRAMRRRKVARWWAVVALVAAWLWLSRGAVLDMLGGPILLPGLIIVVMTLLAGITVVVLFLHNAADEQEHRDRHQNWFRLTERD
jgi:fatty acid desaturase